jgi:hypothetical protein
MLGTYSNIQYPSCCDIISIIVCCIKVSEKLGILYKVLYLMGTDGVGEEE